MSVVTWDMGLNNRQFWEPGLQDRSWHFLLGLAPDIVLVQEALPPSWLHGEGEISCQPVRPMGFGDLLAEVSDRSDPPPREKCLHALGALINKGAT